MKGKSLDGERWVGQRIKKKKKKKKKHATWLLSLAQVSPPCGFEGELSGLIPEIAQDMLRAQNYGWMFVRHNAGCCVPSPE